MIYILLPAYNEEAGLSQVLPVLQDLAPRLDAPLRIVVVDDGSADRTSEVARSFTGRLDLKLITFEKNRGVGEVFREGFTFITNDSRSPGDDVCVVLDSDNTQDPRLMPEMVRRIRNGDDVVIASRFAKGGRMVGCPWARQLFSYGVRWLMRWLVGLPGVRDYSTFYRAYRVSVLKRGFELYGRDLLAGRGFAVGGGLLIKLGNVTKRMSEVPLVLRYDLKGGRSGMRLTRTIRGYVELIGASVRTHRFRPAPGSRPAD